MQLLGGMPDAFLCCMWCTVEPDSTSDSNFEFQGNLTLCRGYQYKAGFLDGIKREVITIYEILRDSANNLLWAVPDYQFTCAFFCFPLYTAMAGTPICNAC